MYGPLIHRPYQSSWFKTGIGPSPTKQKANNDMVSEWNRSLKKKKRPDLTDVLK